MTRYTDARTDYARVTRAEPPSPLLPDALYGLGWTDLELKKRDAAVSDFKRLIKEFPDHATAPPAVIQLGRALIETKHADEAVTLLEGFPTKYPEHRLVPDSRYYLARAKIAAGNTEEGVAQLRAFARTYPSHELVSSARRAAVDSQLKSGKKKDIAEEYAALMAQKPATAEALYDAGALAAGIDRQKDVEAAWGRLRNAFTDHALTGRARPRLCRRPGRRGHAGSRARAALPRAGGDGARVRRPETVGAGRQVLRRGRGGEPGPEPVRLGPDTPAP